MLSPSHPGRRHAQRGMSLIELMVGIAIGLIIVAAASLQPFETTVTFLSPSRRVTTVSARFVKKMLR